MLRTIKEQIDTIFREDPAARSVLEILFCYPVFHAVLAAPAGAHITNGTPLAPSRYSQHSRSLTGIEIHPGATNGRVSSSHTGWAW
jgi:serine O-acetyltransferase